MELLGPMEVVAGEAAATLDALSADALDALLRHLDPVSLQRLSRVSRTLRLAATDEALWAAHLSAAWWDAAREIFPGGPSLPAIRWTELETDCPEQSMRDAREMSSRRLFWRYTARTAPPGHFARGGGGQPEGAGFGVLAAARNLLVGATVTPITAPDPRCPACTDTLRLGGGGGLRRCPCVAARGARLPLKLFSLGVGRSGGSSLASTTFLEMRETLSDLFELEVATPETIVPNALVGVDVAMLCTTEGAALSDEEQNELRRFVTEQGGTAIVSAFSNWSHRQHYNEGLVGWLGVDVQPRAPFGAEGVRHKVKMSPPALPEAAVELGLSSEGETVQRDGCCAWGDVDTFVNTGETMFSLRDDARGFAMNGNPSTPLSLVYFPRELGPHDSVEGEEEGQLPVPEPEPELEPVEAAVPPPAPDMGGMAEARRLRRDRRVAPQGTVAGATATCPRLRRGQCLVLSNYHCFADIGAWSGGHWRQEPGNRALLLNLLSDAIAHRTPEHHLATGPASGAGQ